MLKVMPEVQLESVFQTLSQILKHFKVQPYAIRTNMSEYCTEKREKVLGFLGLEQTLSVVHSIKKVSYSELLILNANCCKTHQM